MKRIGFLSFVILAMLVLTLAFSAAASPKAPAAAAAVAPTSPAAVAPAPVPPRPRVEHAIEAMRSARKNIWSMPRASSMAIAREQLSIWMRLSTKLRSACGSRRVRTWKGSGGVRRRRLFYFSVAPRSQIRDFVRSFNDCGMCSQPRRWRGTHCRSRTPRCSGCDSSESPGG